MADPGVPLIPTIVIIVLLVIVTIGLLIWAIINSNLLNTHDQIANTNPNCLIINCPNNGVEVPYQLDEGKDTYQTVNFCTVNAPPTSFVQAINDCAKGNPTSLTKTQLDDFEAFYNGQYVPKCGYNWKLPPPTPSPLSKSYVDVSQPDTTLINLSTCRNRLT